MLTHFIVMADSLSPGAQSNCGAQLNIGFSGRQSARRPGRFVLLFGIKDRANVANWLQIQQVYRRHPGSGTVGVWG
jgi:hypothetical protein